MPNWSENDWTVEGPKEVPEEFVKFAAGASPFAFNRLVPYPEAYQRLDDAAEAWDKEHAGPPDTDWRLRPKSGFSTGGAEWCMANWGTTSLASHVDVEGPVTVHDGKVQVVHLFDTAWNPPTPVIKKAAELYPALCFELRYYQGCCDVPGLFSCSAGAVSDKSEPYFGSRGE